MIPWRTWARLPMPISEFARTVQRTLRGTGEGDWTYEGEKQLLLGPGGAAINLHNLWREYQAAERGRRQDIVRKVVALAKGAGVQRMPALWTMARDRLFPVIRPRSEETFYALYARLDGHASTARPALAFAGDLCIRLVADCDDALLHVTEEDLVTWGKDAEAVLEVALANLRGLPPPEWTRHDGGFFELHGAPGYQLSYLLLDKARAMLPCNQTAVYMPCNRAILLAADGSDEEACAAMLAYAQACHAEQPWPMSSEMFRLDSQGRWVEAQPPGRVAMAASNHRAVRAAEEYAEQKKLLEKLYERDGRDVFVAQASVVALNSEHGYFRTWCTWPCGIHSELPRTDLVMMTSADPDPADSATLVLRWSDAATVCGDLMQATGLLPQRFEVQGCPSQAQWAELRARAIQVIPAQETAPQN